MAKSRLPVVLMGLGAFLLMQKGAKGAYDHAVKEEVKKHRDKLYKVGPNCEIEPQEGAPSPEQSEKDMEEMWSLYVEPLIHEQWNKGVFLIDDLTDAVMADLFPEVQCTWPPQDGAPQTQKIAYTMMRVFILQGLACDPADPTGNLPPDEVCFEQVEEGYITDWMQMGYSVLKVVHPYYASYMEPFIALVPETQSVFYRAPRHLVEAAASG